MYTMSLFSKSLLERMTYHTTSYGTEIGFENLKKMHPSLTETNPITLAYMACNPSIDEDERQILKECFRRAVDSEQRNLQKFLKERQIESLNVSVNGNILVNNIENDNICGYKNSDINVSISNY
jgi:hypothetical protein